MKTCNFPGMKQARRVGALARLEHQIDVLKGNIKPVYILRDPDLNAIERKESEVATLRERIANVTWFTKKHRAA